MYTHHRIGYEYFYRKQFAKVIKKYSYYHLKYIQQKQLNNSLVIIGLTEITRFFVHHKKMRKVLKPTMPGRYKDLFNISEKDLKKFRRKVKCRQQDAKKNNKNEDKKDYQWQQDVKFPNAGNNCFIAAAVACFLGNNFNIKFWISS